MTDTQYFAQFYFTIFLLGLGVWPLGKYLLPKFSDTGWILSKILGITLVSYTVWFLGIIKLVPFTTVNTLVIAVAFSVLIWTAFILNAVKSKKRPFENIPWRMILISELLLLVTLAGWSIVRAYNPNIHGLEKFMDYGFMLSILRAEYFPPIDHFFASEPINYYYFGHHVAAVVTRLSQLPPNVTYNLQIAYLFAISFMGSFSIVTTLITRSAKKISRIVVVFSGILGGILTAGTGNLHTILNVTELDSYWYATASRLIPFTINEFPFYSFIVADLHAHVSNIPHVLFALGILISVTISSPDSGSGSKKPYYTSRSFILPFLILSLMIGISYATNSWDFPVYLTLSGLVFIYLSWMHYKKLYREKYTLMWAIIKDTSILSLTLLALSVFLMLPFWMTVKPISDGIGIVKDLSPAKEFLTLWGMYLFVAGSFILFVFRDRIGTQLKLSHIKQTIIRTLAKLLGVSLQIKTDKEIAEGKTAPPLTDFIAVLLITVATLLLVLPELIYVRDIYTPDYYRANTMFKIYYAAWILFSIASAYGFVRIIHALKKHPLPSIWRLNAVVSYLLIASTLLYPYMAIKTVTDSFKTYHGLDGTAYLEKQFPNDVAAIDWINQNITGQPVVLEAVGDSYTDYARIAANTGLPTVLGWPVHEWLWRGTYGEPVQPPSRVLEVYGTDTVSQRVDEVKTIYTSSDQDLVWQLLKKYDVEYVYMSTLEQEKYGEIQTEFLRSLGNVVFESEDSTLIHITL